MKLHTQFVPVSLSDMQKNGWDELDVILITGDAYIDHPAFGVALLSRFLIEHGYRVGIIAQPQTDAHFQALGRPRLFFGISSGNMDSMVCHYTAQKKIRSEDAFSPNNQAGLRPDRAVLHYSQKVKQLYKKVPVVLGGIEASMRRIPHYDFWGDKVRNSILIETKASILVYGYGERQILEIADRLSQQKTLENIQGTCILSKEQPAGAVELAEYNSLQDLNAFFKMTHTFVDNFQTKQLYYKHGERFFIHNTPATPFSTAELDHIYDLPFTREPHPMYKGKPIKAFDQIKTSVLSHRGCYGGCTFCALHFHQGRAIQSRSKTSILKEVETITQKRYFKGTITDIAGATANMYGTQCKANLWQTCPKKSCLYPQICKNLAISEKPYLALLRSASQTKGVNHVFISSGVRFDLALLQPEFTQELCFFYTSGHLKLAPEHVASATLHRMSKPEHSKYKKFCTIYKDLSKKVEKEQYILPYLIVGFPGTTTQEAEELHDYLKQNNIKVEQIQEFTPTPMTIATAMYFTHKDFESGEPIPVPKGSEIRRQKNLAQWYKKGEHKQ